MGAAKHLAPRLASGSMQVEIVKGTPNKPSPVRDGFRRQDAFIEAAILVDSQSDSSRIGFDGLTRTRITTRDNEIDRIVAEEVGESFGLFDPDFRQSCVWTLADRLAVADQEKVSAIRRRLRFHTHIAVC